MAETIRYLTDRGIPVMSHIGMTPQAVNMIGSFKPRGRFRSEWAAFEADGRAVAEAGAFAVVLEDMLGLSPRVPKFVKEYAQIGAAIENAVKAYAADVRARVFPSDEYTYPMCDEPAAATKKTKMTGS